MSIATTATGPSGGLLDRIERTAWRVPVPTRRFFQIVAATAALALALSGLGAGWVVARNARTIDAARAEGLELATAVTEFRTRLVAADATAAETLIAGGLEDAERRAAYDRDLLAASQALTEAALVATDEDGEQVGRMAADLVEYAGLVETSRANSRLGYPVGAAYLGEARDLANESMVPRADMVRREGERRIAQATNSVGGPVTVLAVALLVAALVVVVVCSVLLAGRTRRAVQPAVLVATLLAAGGLAFVVDGIRSQTRELREAAGGDIEAYVLANDVAAALADLRVTEISAVASRGSGAPHYEEFAARTTELQDELAGATDDADRVERMRAAIDAYTTAVVEEVQAADEAGDNREAANLVLSQSEEGAGSQDAYEAAVALVQDNVDRASSDLVDRFDAAADANVEPAVPVVLGGLSGLLAAAGVLARGRRYR